MSVSFLFFNSFCCPAVLYFLLQVSFLVDEGVSPVLLQLLSCALCGSKVLASNSSTSSSFSGGGSGSAGQTGSQSSQSKSSSKKSKKEDKEKEKDGEKIKQMTLVILLVYKHILDTEMGSSPPLNLNRI